MSETGSLPAQRTRLLVEGWRFVPHSYAIVNQWQLLAFRRRTDVDLRVRDAPYLYPHWKSTRGLFHPDDEAVIASLPQGGAAGSYDVLLRIGFPYDFAPGPARRTAVFVTSEFGGVPTNHFAPATNFVQAARRDDLLVVTPSNWAAQASYARGLRRDQVLVLPHGVDPATFRPMPEKRDEIRQSLNLDGVVFLSVGAMTPNKGIILLLKAFAAVAQKRKDVRLVLKGLDSLHSSRDVLSRQLAVLTPGERSAVLTRTLYIGESYSMSEMADLYQAADVYVSSYHAEGFNIPVLEAAASGVPLIVTAGGSTDDFVTEAFARKIRSTVDVVRYDDVMGRQLNPDLEHLIALMESAACDEVWRRSAGADASRHSHAHFNWGRVVQSFLDAVRT